MKKIISAVLTAIILCIILSGCTERRLEVSDGEIAVKNEKYAVSFTVVNNTGKTITDLSIEVQTYLKNDKKSDSGRAVYPIAVENGAEATLSLITEKECVSARALSYSYKTGSGKEKSGEFKTAAVAYMKEKSGEAKTRQQLADKIIRDVKNQFLIKGSYSTGSYDAEEKRLVIVSRYTQDFDTCCALYEKEPSMWDSLADGIVSMSKTCLEEFQENGFSDVIVNVGVMSSDEKLLFSATDGELVQTPDTSVDLKK